MIALYTCLAVALVLLVVVLLAQFRPAALAPVARPLVALWRRRTAADYGRHSTANTPPTGLRMRDPAGGVDTTGPVPVRVPRRRR